MVKLRALPVLLASSCLLIAAVGPADAAKKKCENKKEKTGCSLPMGAIYEGALPPGGGAAVVVEEKTWMVNMQGSDRATGSGPCNPRFNRTSIEFKGRPKVGKTYTLKQDVKRNERGTENAVTVSGTVKITSAKKATFSGSFSSQRSFRGEVFGACQRSLNNASATREK